MTQPLFIIFLFFSAANSACDPIELYNTEFKPRLGGKSLGKLTLIQNRIGSGSFGDVFKAEWDNKPAALKKNEILEEDSEQFFIKEAHFLSLLKSTPGVVDFYGCLKNNLYYFFFFERLAGSLESSKSKFLALSLARRINFYKQLAFVVAEVNAKGVLHNDLKPENVMTIDEDFSSPKLIDFGLSCDLNDQTRGHCSGGSEIFISPEKAHTLDEDGNFLPNEKIDVWAFLLTIVDTENPEESEIDFFEDMDDDCFYVNFDELCYEELIKNIRQIFKEENDSLLKFVLSNLQHDSTKRKTMWQLGQELMLMERQEPSFDINKVPAKDFTSAPKYQIKEDNEENLRKTVEQYASSQKHKKLVL